MNIAERIAATALGIAAITGPACAPATGSYQGQDNRGTPQGRAETPKPPEWTRYSSSMGYQMERLSTWAVGPGGPNEEVWVTDLSLFIRVGSSSLQPGTTLENLMQIPNIRDGYQATNLNKDTVKANRVTVSGVSGWRVSRRNTPASNLRGEAETLAFTKNGKAWFVTFETISSGVIDQKIPTIDRVFSSFTAN